MNWLAIIGASLIGSLHCAAMCGGFATWISATPGQTPQASRFARIAYHSARLIAYTGLGALAGSIGLGLEATTSLFGLRPLASIVLLLAVIAAALTTVWPRRVLTRIQTKPSRSSLVQTIRRWILQGRAQLGPLPFAAMVGFATALLPCAWLWAYVMVAASSGHPFDGALTMAAFWLGSVPALSFADFFFSALRRRLGAASPRVVALAITALAALNLYEHWPSSSTTTLERPCHTP